MATWTPNAVDILFERLETALVNQWFLDMAGRPVRLEAGDFMLMCRTPRDDRWWACFKNRITRNYLRITADGDVRLDYTVSDRPWLRGTFESNNAEVTA
jgi:hypothetical protein